MKSKVETGGSAIEVCSCDEREDNTMVYVPADGRLPLASED